MYLLDTNVLNYFFKGQGKVGERLFEVSAAEVALPAVVVYELEDRPQQNPRAESDPRAFYPKISRGPANG